MDNEAKPERRGEALSDTLPGSLLGVRQWVWLRRGRLASLRWTTHGPDSQYGPAASTNLLWEPGDVMHASHYVPPRPTKSAPQLLHETPKGCPKCGLYAFYDLGLAEKAILYNGVWGIVEAWGDIEEHERGFRAQRMRPLAILHFQGWSVEAAKAYDLPLVPGVLSQVREWMRRGAGATFIEGGQKWQGLDGE